MALHAMTPVDAAWYHIDGPANLAIVTSLMLTKTPLDFRRVRSLYVNRLARIDRFHQQVVERGLRRIPHWKDMEDFDIDQHVHHLALPAPHDHGALIALVNDLASTPLDRALPLWQVHVVDDVEDGGAVITRYHHCIGDGTAMMAVIQRLFDATPAAAVRGAPRAARSLQMASLAGFAAGKLATAKARELAAHPQHLLERAGLLLAGAGVLVKDLLKWPDPKSPLKGEFHRPKRVAWSQPVDIAHVKAIGAPLGAKVNDVLVAAMTGALRHYLKLRGVKVDATTVRAMVPVDLRPPERFGKLGNEFGLVILELAVAKARLKDRLALTKARMDALKRSPEAQVMRLLFDIFGRGPKPLEDLANLIFGSKASIVMTNVAGPRAPLYFAGTEVDRMMFWVPHPGRQLGMGISIYSYRGQASLAVISDARLVPDPERITRQFNREFEAMRRSANAQEEGPRPQRATARGRHAQSRQVARR